MMFWRQTFGPAVEPETTIDTALSALSTDTINGALVVDRDAICVKAIWDGKAMPGNLT